MLLFIATACAGVFAGAAVFISVVYHPAASDLGPATTARLFTPMYERAAPMQAGLAVVGAAAGLLGALFGGSFQGLLAALLLGSVVPYTLVRMAPVNDQLLAADLDADGPEVPALLERWASMHRVRSIASTLAFLLFLGV